VCRQAERERAVEAYSLAGRMFEDMGVGPGERRVKATLASLGVAWPSERTLEPPART
jgi:hypothetical protein